MRERFDTIRGMNIQAWSAEHADYLRDESRRTGSAEAIAFPESEAEVRAVLAEAAQSGQPVTVQGARTGITAGAVPNGGLVLNLSRMKAFSGLRKSAVDGLFRVKVQPGLLLDEVRAALLDPSQSPVLSPLQSAPAQFFSPDPTETTASIGGMIACNASGALSFRYGATRGHITALRVMLADGGVLALERGKQKAEGRAFALVTEEGRRYEGRLPSYQMPAVKNASGYYAADGMDLVDLFIGAEGTLGVVTEAELALLPRPPVVWGVVSFFPSEAGALKFVRVLRGEGGAFSQGPAAIEFFDARSLDLIRAQPVEGLPAPAPEHQAAIYTEWHGEEEEALAAALEEMAAALSACGGDEASTWSGMDAREMERLHKFRHGVPERVNARIDERRRTEPGLTKLGTDMSVPSAALEDVLRMYHEGLAAAGLDYVIFGHIGNNHVHVNILPRSLEEYQQGKALYLSWAERVIQWGGSVSAEHGIGKLKTDLLERMVGREGVEEMRRIKRLLDPAGRLNPGNLFL